MRSRHAFHGGRPDRLKVRAAIQQWSALGRLREHPRAKGFAGCQALSQR